MAQILDTIPAFDAFARKAFLESPYGREVSWEHDYEGAHPDVFKAFYGIEPGTSGRAALVRDLSSVRKVAAGAAPVMAELIADVEPAVAKAIGAPSGAEPRHVLLVGPMSASAVVGRLDGQVALFHCLEWFTSAEGARILVAHEDTHALHEMILGESAPTAASPTSDAGAGAAATTADAGPGAAASLDAAWTAFSEGLAVQVSRVVVSGRADEDYFWYGYEGFADWLPWCREQRAMLKERFAAALDDPAATEEFFGAGLVEGRWRVGMFLADELVAGLRRPLTELAAMTPDQGRAAIRQALGVR